MNLAVTVYVLTLAVFIPLSGWFADRYGMRMIFVLALATITVGSALCGLADSFRCCSPPAPSCAIMRVCA